MSATTLLLQLGLTIVFLAIAAAGIIWAIKNGQYDDFEGPAQRILMDDDDPMIPFNTDQKKKSDTIQVETKSHKE